MWKGSIFSDWSGEQFASIWQITDLVEANKSGLGASIFRFELHLTLHKKWSAV